MEITIAAIYWFLLSVVIGIAARNRRIGFIGAFFCSMLLSPVSGLILAAFSDKKDSYYFYDDYYGEED